MTKEQVDMSNETRPTQGAKFCTKSKDVYSGTFELPASPTVILLLSETAGHGEEN